MVAKNNRYRVTNTYITIGDSKAILADWSAMYKIPVPVILQRVSRGWSWEDAITTPRRDYGDRSGDSAED